MECEESGVSAPTDGSEGNKKKNYRNKVYDLKFLKKKLPAYVNLTKSDDSSNVRRGLIGLKTILLSSSEGEHIFYALQSCEGLKQIVKLISSSTDQRQLGTVLCILHLAWNRIGNITFRLEVLQSGAVACLADILVKSSDPNNILRAIKLLNALSQQQESTKEFNNASITDSLVTLLNRSSNFYVQIATIKTMRRLWTGEKSHGRLLEWRSVQAVATFLGTSDSLLFASVLKTLLLFTNPCSQSAAQQMFGTKGDGYQNIVSKLTKPEVSELVCNLCQSTVGRIELTRVGIIPEILKQIRLKKYDKYLIMAFCRLCQESMVRASLRETPFSFETFVSLFTNKAVDQYHSDLLFALTFFVYDTVSLTMMVRAGLVDILVEKLSELATSTGICHEATPPEFKTCAEYSSTSPSSSPTSPPFPCCTFETFSYPFSTFDCGSKKKRKETEDYPMKSPDYSILEVMLHLVYQHTKLKTFALRETIDTILRYMTTVDFTKQESAFFRATKTIRAIVGCKYHFNKLLDDKTIMSIHQELCVKRHPKCTYCDKLYLSGQVILNEMSDCSESALGEGEMAHRLTDGNPLMKTNVALTIPLIIKQPRLLMNLLLMHDGLGCLIKALDSHIDEAVPALHSLMRTIGITNPQQKNKSDSDSEDISMIESSTEEGTGDVKFELDDGSAVSACKEKLGQNYPMFEAMFRGGFKEAGAETVRLPGVSAACLRALVSLDSADPSPSMLPSSVSTLLEMVSTSDRFLSPNLAKNLLSHIVHRVLSSETSPEIYSWSVNTGCTLPFSSFMAVTTVSYLFTANIFFEDRVKAVREIINSPERQHLLCDLNSIIICGLKDYHDKVNRHSRYFMVSPKYILL